MNYLKEKKELIEENIQIIETQSKIAEENVNYFLPFSKST